MKQLTGQRAAIVKALAPLGAITHEQIADAMWPGAQRPPSASGCANSTMRQVRLYLAKHDIRVEGVRGWGYKVSGSTSLERLQQLARAVVGR